MRSYAKSVFFLVSLLLSITSFAANWYVDDNSNTNDIYTIGSASGSDGAAGTALAPFASLTKALSLAANGDVIYIDKGNYNDGYFTISKSVSIIGAGISNSVYTGNGNHYFAKIATSNLLIKNLTVKGYGSQDLQKGQVFDINGPYTGIIFDNLVISNSNGSSIEVYGNISVQGGASVTVKNSFFKCSGFNGSYGGGMTVKSSSLTVINTVFFNTDNLASKGGAIDIQGSSNVVVNNCTFDTNTATDGGAIGIQGTSTVSISGSCFSGNKTEGSFPLSENGGGAIYTSSSGVINITDCSFSNNCTGIGINTLPSASGALVQCAVAGTNPKGGAIRQTSGTLNLTRVSFTNNSSSKSSSAIDIQKDGGTLNLIDVSFNTINSSNYVNIVNSSGVLSFNNSGQPVSNGSGVSVSKPEVSGAVAPTIINSNTPSASPVTNCLLTSSIIPCSQNVNCATELSPPIIIKCVEDKTLTDCSPLLNYTSEVSAFDNCSFTVTQTPAPGSSLTDGANSITMSVSDGKNAPVTCVFTVNATGCASSPTPPLPPSGNSAQVFCSSVNPKISDLVVTGSNIKWYNASSAGTEYTSPSTTTLVDGTTYYASQTVLGVESASRLEVTVTITTSPVASFISSAATSTCSNTDVVYTTESGMTDYTWTVPGTINVDYKIISGGTGSTDNTVTIQWLTAGNKTVTVGYKSGSCVSSNTASSSTNVVLSPSISNTTSASQSFCASTNPTVANLLPASSASVDIKWYDNSVGGNLLTPTTALVDATKYYASAVLTGSPACESISRFEVTVSVTSSLTASFLASPASSTCSNTDVTYTTESGKTDYSWTVPGTVNVDYKIIAGGLGSTDNTVTIQWLTAGNKTVTVGYKTGLCVTTTLATNTTNVAITPVISNTTSNSQSFCLSNNPTVADLVATSSAGTTINWYSDNITTTTLVGNQTLVDGNKYYATALTSGSPSCESNTRYEVTVTIIDPSVPSTTNAIQSFCSSATPKVANLSATGSAGSSITWYDAATGGTAFAATASLVDAKKYYATQTTSGTLSCESTQRLEVTVSIIDPSVPTSTNTSQSFCSSTSPKVADLVASTTPGTSLKWYDAITNGTAYATTDALETGKTYYAVESTTGTPSCESASRLAISVTIIAPVLPTTTNASQSFCSSATAKVADLVATTTSGASLKWYNAATNGVAYTSTDLLESGKTYYAVAVISGTPTCESASRLAVSVTIISPTLPTTNNASQSFCSSASPKVADLVATTTSGASLKWYNAATNGVAYTSTDVLETGKTYYAVAVISGTPTCESASRLTVSVSIIDPAVPTTTNTNQTFCIADDPKVSNLSATVSSGSGVNWYNSSTSINALPNTDALINGATYYAAEVIVGTPSCESTTRLAVTVKVNSLPGSPTGSKKQYFCFNNNPVVSNLVAKGVALKWYDAASGGTLYDVNTPLVNGGHYFATQTVNQGCEGVLRLEVIAYVSNPSVTLESKKEPFCNKNDGGLSVTTTEGFGKYLYTWDNGTTSNVIENIGQGTYTVKVSDSINCETEGVFDLECIKLPVPQVVTPGDNGKNDTWVLNLTPKSEVKIFNRWGSLIYAASPYQDDWKGQTNQGASLGNGYLPSGTYFYTIDTKEGTKPLSGYVELIR